MELRCLKHQVSCKPNTYVFGEIFEIDDEMGGHLIECGLAEVAPEPDDGVAGMADGPTEDVQDSEDTQEDDGTGVSSESIEGTDTPSEEKVLPGLSPGPARTGVKNSDTVKPNSSQNPLVTKKTRRKTKDKLE